MAKADLHVHSKYSNHPSEWFLQRLGTAESYTEPDFIYHTAKKRGMDFVTITDHNNAEGSFYLAEKYPEECFSGVEATAYFPEDNCKIHILIYNFTKEQFSIIQQKRKNIYDLQKYLIDEDLPHSVAHATFSVRGTIQTSHLEKLSVMFGVFEEINGARNQSNNIRCSEYLKQLSLHDLEHFRQKHDIEYPDGFYNKGFTGGSDDHAGLFIGKTYTVSEANSKEEFIYRLKTRQTRAEGRHHNFQAMAFSIYKIAFDFAKTKAKNLGTTPYAALHEQFFSHKKPGFKNRILINLFSKRKWKESQLKKIISKFIEAIQKLEEEDIDLRFHTVFAHISSLTDELARLCISTFKKGIRKGKFDHIVRSVSTLLPTLMLYAPFITAMASMSAGRNITGKSLQSIGKTEDYKKQHILICTDTLHANSNAAHAVKSHMINYGEDGTYYFAVVLNQDLASILPGNISVCYPQVLEVFESPFNKNEKIRIPSILDTLNMIYMQDPDEILITSPGPMGIIGLLAAKLLDIPVRLFFFSDPAKAAGKETGDISITSTIDSYLKWFYQCCETVYLPSPDILEELERRGFEIDSLKVAQNLFLYSTNSFQEIVLM
ncbi:MAG: hypothetical protein ACLFR1_13430 [Spirochaetia bacterium]